MMRKSTAFSLVVMTLTASTAIDGQVEYSNGIFSPEQGVVYDREGNFWADSTHNGVMCTVETQCCATHGKFNKTSKKIQAMVFGK